MRSRVTLAGHPVHPMLVPFPIAFLVGVLVTDLIFLGTGNAYWAQSSVYLALAGLVTGVAAAMVGFTDFVTLPQVRSHRMAWIHFIGNALVLLLALARTLYSWDAPTETVRGTGLVLSAAMTALLLLTGWAGGELAYRHKIGVIEDDT
ncbi:MAG: DUF2231 domain-containing protein [Gammaproteobacteria bacterium]|nr:DUF2231 domain-containing protein [Gammaproteobacteria bacterium]